MSSFQECQEPYFTICARIKPPKNFKERVIFNNFRNDKQLYVSENKVNFMKDAYVEKRDYHFNKVYDIDYTNEDIFADIGIKITNGFLSGESITCFLFGQTGSGKTHTMLGNDSTDGIAQMIFDRLIDETAKNDTSAYISCIQIYNRSLLDVINGNHAVKYFQSNNGYGMIKDCKTMRLNKNNRETILNAILSNRHTGISSANSTSSRSHLMIRIQMRNYELVLMDMAGSEKASQSHNVGPNQMRENAYINKGILILKECIRAVKSRKTYIPYKQHILTRLLSKIFTGQSRSYIMATVSSDVENVNDSINTLNYVSDMKSLKRNGSEQNISRVPSKVIIKNENKMNDIDDYFKEIGKSNKKREKLLEAFNAHDYDAFRIRMRELIRKEIVQLQDLSNIV
jgi:kinesin family protein 2/24|uniref:Kinesin motor domain-containing protein n=1 Tax=viral metagenome TaxID=1070528 RepID=A0A6C0JDU3_9ZZZZ